MSLICKACSGKIFLAHFNYSHHLGRLLCLVNGLMVSVFCQAFTCGPPTINSAAPPALYIWQDCVTSEWTLWVEGGGDYANFQGKVFSDADINNLKTINIGSNDSLAQGQKSVDFSIQVWNQFHNAITFNVNGNGRLFLDIKDFAGKQVYAGKDLEAVNAFPLRVGGSGKQYNIVFVLTDDQRFDTLWSMPILQAKLANPGITFDQAIVTTPLCCPARASILSGGLLDQNTGVYTNTLPTGTFTLFHDAQNLGTILQQAGYRTGLVGKVMNGYPEGYVMPGWDYMVANVGPSRDNWNKFNVTIGASTNTATNGQVVGPITQYVTDFQRDRVLDFLSSNDTRPFFVMLSTYAPHAPATPAAVDRGLFDSYSYQGRGVTESDLSDKPRWVWDPVMAKSVKVPELAFPGEQLASLQAVDRALGDIINTLEVSGKIDDTVIVFTSDNGYMWGEHGIWRKTHEFEESLKVPLVILMPSVAPRVETRQVASDIDLPALFLDLANASFPSDGESLLPLILNPQSNWREELLVNLYTHQSIYRSWVGVRSNEWKYIENMNGDRMLFDLLNDPFELDNLAGLTQYAAREAYLKNKMDQEMGVVISSLSLPDPMIGLYYEQALTAKGGTPPYTWSIVNQAVNVSLGKLKWPVGNKSMPLDLGRNASFCGQPTVQLDNTRRFYLWRDCNADKWYIRGTGNGAYTRYQGVINSSLPRLSEAPYQLNSADLVNPLSSGVLDFIFQIWVNNDNGVDLELEAGSDLTLDVTGDDAFEFALGAKAIDYSAHSMPITIENEISCGQPILNPGSDSGVFVWQDCNTRVWSLRVLGGNEFQDISGRLSAQGSVSLLNTVNIGSSDTVDTSSGDIDFSIQVWAGAENGFDFTVPNGVPLELDVDMHDLPFGLSLDAGTGVISGIPSRRQSRSIQIKVEDRSVRKIDGNPQAFIVNYELDIQ